MALFSTGDELRAVEQALAPGQIHDSNRYSMFGLLTELGVEIEDLGVVPDRRDALDEALQQASRCDAVVSTGGASVGEADYVVEALARPALPLQVALPLAADIRKRHSRREFQRGRMVWTERGPAVAPFGHQGSGVLRSMSEADCLINLAPEQGDLAKGDTVVVEPFAQKVWNGN